MKALLLSGNNELFSSLKRAMKFLVNIDLLKFSGRFHKNNTVIYDMDKNEIDSWLWGKFRIKALSPLVVIGAEDKDSFINKNPVFSAYSDEHAYFQIPFELSIFIDKVHNMKPVYDHVTRKQMVKDFSNEHEHKLITHDLKIIKGDKTATIDNLLQVRDFYRSKGHRKIVNIIDEKIKEIQTKDNWEKIALEIKQHLEEGLKRSR